MTQVEKFEFGLMNEAKFELRPAKTVVIKLVDARISIQTSWANVKFLHSGLKS